MLAVRRVLLSIGSWEGGPGGLLQINKLQEHKTLLFMSLILVVTCNESLL